MGKDLKGKELGQGLSQRKNGMYSARFRGKSGKRAEKYFSTISEAKAWLINARYKDEHETVYAGSNMSVDAWFSFWLDDIKGEAIRYGTRQAYRTRYNSRIRSEIGRMALSEVRPFHCQRIINQAQEAGESEWSLKKIRVILKAIFEAAVDNMMIEKNPVTKNVKILRQEKKEPRVLTLSEQDELLRKASGSAHYDAFRFILETGVRGGELGGLRWEDVDIEGRKIRISHSLEYRTDIKKFVNNPPKTKSSVRTIPLTQAACDILVACQEAQRRMNIPDEFDGYVFLNSNGRPTHRGIYNRALRQIAKKMGVPSFSMHSLRHTFATRCMEAGVKPKTLQKLMGHSELGITMDLYVHVTEDEAEKEIRLFENHSHHSKAI